MVTLDDLTHETIVAARIGNTGFIGKISVNEYDSIYICHDVPELEGSAPTDKLGYRYGWIIYNPDWGIDLETALLDMDVEEIETIKKGKPKKKLKQKQLTW